MSYCFGCDQLPCVCAEGGDGTELRHLKRQLAELSQLNEANDKVQVKLIRENHELRDALNARPTEDAVVERIAEYVESHRGSMALNETERVVAGLAADIRAGRWKGGK